MKKFLVFTLVALSITFTGCYDDSALWNEIDDLDQRVTNLETVVEDVNNNIDALQTLVNALQNQVSIVSVTEIANGYTILFSDGTTATITNGLDANAPIAPTCPSPRRSPQDSARAPAPAAAAGRFGSAC